MWIRDARHATRHQPDQNSLESPRFESLQESEANQMNDLQLFAPSRGLGAYREDIAIDRNTVIISPSAKPTSASAALNALPKSGSKRRRVYEYLKQTGGATDEEIERALGISGNTVRPTRGSLVKDKFVYATDLERPTLAGNMAIVWKAR
jgi:hypothetical protein